MEQWLLNLTPHVIWILFILLVIFRFPNLFREFVAGISKLSITGEGVELERAVVKASEVIQEKEGKANTSLVQRHLSRLPIRKRILWVDDHPDGNTLEQEAFEAAGITVIHARSNEEACEKFLGTSYNLVISDIDRDSGDSGIELPRSLCDDRNRVPPIIYYVGHAEAPRTSDGYPVTSRPSVLFEWVGDILRLQNS